MAHQENKIVETILPSDVLHGRGKSVHFHVGNVAYRRLVKAKACDYQRLTGMEKDDIARQVIRIIEHRGGRFLRPVGDGSQWVKCPYHIVRTRVKQALRDITKVKPPNERSLHKTLPTARKKPKPRFVVGERAEIDLAEGRVNETAHGIPSIQRITFDNLRKSQPDTITRHANEGPASNSTHSRIPEMIVGDVEQRLVSSPCRTNMLLERFHPQAEAGVGDSLLQVGSAFQNNRFAAQTQFLPALSLSGITPASGMASPFHLVGDPAPSFAAWLHNSLQLQAQQRARNDLSLLLESDREMIELLRRLR